MAGIADFFNTIQNLRSALENVSKDIDPQDSREKTEQDLNDLTAKFDQLKHTFSQINRKDMEKIQSEVKELMSGKQNFLEYARDVNAILAEVRNRTENNGELQEKIKRNLPEQHKEEGVGSFFQNLSSVLNEVSRWSEKVTK